MDENSGNSPWSTDVPEELDGAAPDIAPVTWSASEFISHQKTTAWYVKLGVVAALITSVVIYVTGSLVSGFVVALTCGVLGIFAARQPETKQYEINDRGVKAGDREFPYGAFKSFSLVEEGAVNSIWLRPLRRYVPTVVMYFAPEDEEKIVSTLENFLPEEDRALDAIDRFTRRIRF